MNVDVALMSRRDCHLCEVVAADLSRILPEYGLSARVVDVDTNDELRAEYGDRVPVVVVNGEDHADYRLDEARLRADLERLARG